MDSTWCCAASFRVAPCLQFALGADIDMNHVGMATDRTVLNIMLHRALRVVDWDDDFFPARITNITGFILHGFLFLPRGEPRSTVRLIEDADANVFVTSFHGGPGMYLNRDDAFEWDVV